MAAIDPTTGQALPANAIQRVLFIGKQVHVYQIPPLTSTKGYTASSWTDDPARNIFTGRLRVVETGYDDDDDDDSQSHNETVKVDILLEDPASGQLFAAAPYTDASAVEPALDSSRFFALRVQDGQGRRAVLGLGFEERPDAFDFGVALQEARKAAGVDKPAAGTAGAAPAKQEPKRDYSLKEGETITINIGGSSKVRRDKPEPAPASSQNLSSFALAPPPSAASFSLPPPPPPPRRTANRRSVGDPNLLAQQMQAQMQAQRDEQDKHQQKQSAAALGFDDGQNDEFA